MSKQKLNLKNILSPSDSIAIIVIIVGLLIAVFMQEMALRLIGLSLVLLGVVRLFMFISQRMSLLVDSNKYKPITPPPHFKVTEKQDVKAKRVVIENFEAQFGPEKEKVNFEESKPFPDELQKPITTDEGFRIVNKDNDQYVSIQEQAPVIKTQGTSLSFSEDLDNLEFEDEFSGIKIVGKKPAIPTTDTVTEHLNKVPEPEPEKELVAEQASTIEMPFSRPMEETSVPIAQAVPLPESDVESVTSEKQFIYKKKQLDIPISVLMDSTPIMGQEPRKEFEYFLSRVLMVIRSVTSTRTAVFMLVNHEREQLILEAYESDVPDAITTVRKIEFSNDIVTQIVLNVKPEILTEINPSAELDLIPYYTRSVGTLSFIGVPVFYQNSVVGILCADSDIANAYDHTIVSFLGHFTKLIGGLVHSYTEKYDLMQASRALTAINNLRSITGMQGATMDSIYEAIIDSVSNLFEYSKIGICGWDDSDNTWRINALKVRDKSEANLLGTVIDIKSSMLGECLSHAKTVFVLPLSEKDLRVSQDEHVMTTGFFVAVPLKSLSNNYGAIFIEGKNIGGFNTLDIGILETISNHSGSAIEQLLMTNIMQKSSMIDNNTGLMNTPAFFQRINQELIRSLEFEVPLTVCLIQIDKYLSFDPEVYHERSEQVLIHVLNIIRKRLRPYDIMGRANSNIFGIGLIGVKLQESKIWAERLRSEIAISVMELNTKRFTVTVSIGLAGSHGVTDVNELVSNSYKVLEISKKKSNCVTVFE